MNAVRVAPSATDGEIVANDGRRDPTNLDQLLDCVRDAAGDSDSVSVGDVLDMIGRRSFGPALLLAGVVTLAPVIGDVPGVPTIVAAFVFLVAVQVLLRQDHVWLPRWLLSRSVSQRKLLKAVARMKRPAQVVDRFLRPRLTRFVTHEGVYVIAVISVLVALAMPIMEFVPFSANAAGLVLTLFGFSMVAHDGLLAVAGFSFTVVTAALAAWYLF